MVKAQELSINFLVKFILAVVLFGLGTVLMWNIYFASTDTLDVSQQEFDRRIFALNCKPSETVCIGANNLDIASGESVLISVKIFNNHNEEHSYDVTMELRDSDNQPVPTTNYKILPTSYVAERISAKDSKELNILFKTDKRMAEGDYALRILVEPDSSQMRDIPKRIYITIT